MYIYNAIVKSILDANNIEATLDLGFGLTIRRVFKISGANAPSIFESKTDAEKELAILAKEFATKLLLNKRVELEPIKVGKYGRYEAVIYIREIDLDYLEALKREGYT